MQLINDLKSKSITNTGKEQVEKSAKLINFNYMHQSKLRRLSAMLYWLNIGLLLVWNSKSNQTDSISIYISLRIHFSYKRSDFIMIYK